MVEVSVIIPTKNEEKTIGRCIEKIKRVFEEHNIDGEIIISDSSTDRTPEIARSLGAKVVTPDKLGYGYAYIYAFKFARGKFIVIGDGDDTYDFLEISAVYARSMGMIEYDRITRLISRVMTLERGLLMGIFLTSLGFFYILLLIREWVNSGFRNLPMLNQDIFGFTVFILGLQTIFFSFFLSLALENQHATAERGVRPRSSF